MLTVRSFMPCRSLLPWRCPPQGSHGLSSTGLNAQALERLRSLSGRFAGPGSRARRTPEVWKELPRRMIGSHPRLHRQGFCQECSERYLPRIPASASRRSSPPMAHTGVDFSHNLPVLRLDRSFFSTDPSAHLKKMIGRHQERPSEATPQGYVRNSLPVQRVSSGCSQEPVTSFFSVLPARTWKIR